MIEYKILKIGDTCIYISFYCCGSNCVSSEQFCIKTYKNETTYLISTDRQRIHEPYMVSNDLEAIDLYLTCMFCNVTLITKEQITAVLNVMKLGGTPGVATYLQSLHMKEMSDDI